MILQNFILPKISICDKNELYCNLQNAYIDFENNQIVLHAASKVKFDTYFNSFLCDRWKKYTYIENLSLELRGKGRGILRAYRKTSHMQSEQLILIKEVELHEENELRVELFDNISDIYGILYIEYEAISDTVLFGAKFLTDRQPERPVSLGVVVTTFKREQYVTRNLHSFENGLFNVMPSEQLHVYIVDNGQSLDISNTERATIIPNANYGGVGGFTRGMIEIEEQGRHTHIIFCDDDAVYEPESFIRLHAFLSIAKDANLCVGGTMFKLDNPSVVHETGASFYNGKYYSNKSRLVINDIGKIVEFDTEEYCNYYGWWFFAFPVKLARITGYPMPFFFQFDDIEFGLRLKRRGIITTYLNGVCVWHESFERKSSTVTCYYVARNMSITWLIHDHKVNALKLVKQIIRMVCGSLLTYRYNRAYMFIRGFIDFLKGPAYIKSLNPPELHKKLMSVQKEKMKFISPDLILLQKYDRPVRNYLLKRVIMLLTLNGMIMPSFLIDKNKGTLSKGYVIESLHSNRLGAIFKKETVLYIDINSRSGYITNRNTYQFLKGTLKLFYLIIKVLVKFKFVRSAYQKEFPTMITRDFWKEYLAKGNN